MAQDTIPPQEGYFREIPVAAIVYSNLLAESLHTYSLDISGFKRYASYAVTAALLFISISGMYLVGSVLVAETSSNSGKPPARSTAAPASSRAKSAAYLPKSAPTQLKIPSIGLTAGAVEVGQNDDGTMEVPGADVVGWYNLGPAPGELGPAVITGHVDSAISGPAVFWDLEKVQVGDDISITRADGKTVTFKVEKSESYDQSNFPTNAVYGNLNYPGLRLITCDGDFNYLTRHYSHNLVVYAKAVL
ncbi:MAG: peptidase sortase [Candidatus Saccharibacteria bacterium]|nr:peptidase sortase [Candidatus Saccharibacteria bacterium]